MRYKGQGHEIEIELPPQPLTSADKTALQSLFEEAYQQQFSRPVPGMQIEILNWGVSVSTPTTAKPRVNAVSANADTTPAHTNCTIVCDVTGNQVSARCFKRDTLTAGTTINGPALIQEPQTTTLVSADFSAHIDSAGNIHLQRKAKNT